VEADRTTFRAVFAVREFRALWAAEALSQAGDQVARVALAVLVYGATESAALAGLTYALLYVRTGKLWTPVIAHVVANGALCLWVAATGRWALW